MPDSAMLPQPCTKRFPDLSNLLKRSGQ